MSKNSSKPSVLISDLGNVLAFFDHRTIARNLAAQLELDSEEIYLRFVNAGIHHEYGLGLIDDETFYKRAKELLNHREFPDFKEFSIAWSDIFTTNWLMVETLREWEKKLTLVLLSNTNNLHFCWIEKHHPEIVELFGENLVLSHQVGAAKPDERIFREAIRVSGAALQPSDCIFIDDIYEYVEAAKSLGMLSYHYRVHEDFTLWLKTVFA